MEHLQPQFREWSALKDVIQVVVGIHHGENLGKDVRHDVFQVHPERLPEKGGDAARRIASLPPTKKPSSAQGTASVLKSHPVKQNHPTASEDAKRGRPGLRLTILAYLTVNECCFASRKALPKEASSKIDSAFN